MRLHMPGYWVGVLALAAVAANGQDLNFTLNPYTGSGAATNLTPNPDPPCLPLNCVLFTGTLFDTDTDNSDLLLDSIGVAFPSGPASGSLTVDNTFYDSTDYVPGVLSGDPNFATDGSGNPPNIYQGPIFGIDIAPGTTPGQYTATVTINAAGGTLDPNYNGFTVSQTITVDVVPEPAAAVLAFTGLAALAAWRGVKRKWRSSEA